MTQLELPHLGGSNATPIKTCSVCREQKPATAFASDRAKPDGLFRMCRACDADRRKKRWAENREHLKAKSRIRYRADLETNRAKSAERRRSERGRAINRRAVASYRERNAAKRAAHHAVRRALASGEVVKPNRCERAELGQCCGRIEAHHADYGKPLEVTWLCIHHHNEAHTAERPMWIGPAPLLECTAGGDVSSPPVVTSLPVVMSSRAVISPPVAVSSANPTVPARAGTHFPSEREGLCRGQLTDGHSPWRSK